jgi:hypothetical protein
VRLPTFDTIVLLSQWWHPSTVDFQKFSSKLDSSVKFGSLTHDETILIPSLLNSFLQFAISG